MALGLGRSAWQKQSTTWAKSSIRCATKVATALLIVVTLVGAGCSHPQAPQNATPAAPPATTTRASPTQAHGAPVGIIVERWQSQVTTIGVIDLIDHKTGRYSPYASFPVGHTVGDEPAGPDYALSDDFSRYSDTRNAHAGWVDRSGTFTDVNANTPTPNPFDPPASSFQDLGFDRPGNFYYAETRYSGSPPKYDVRRLLFKVARGVTQGPGQQLGELDDQQGLALDFKGEVPQNPDECFPTGAAQWLSQDEYLGVIDSTTLVRVTESSCGRGVVSLLPVSNGSDVYHPVPSPDGTQLAFKRGTNELWIVDVSGHGGPRQVTVTGINKEELADYYPIRWK
jgi:hypothetical protein